MVVAGVIGKLSEGAVFLLFLPLPPTDPPAAGSPSHTGAPYSSKLPGVPQEEQRWGS